MRKILTNNIGLKLVSVLCAVILWFVVVNVDDPTDVRDFTQIPVTILNENEITDQGMVFKVLDESNFVTIRVTAKRSILESLTKEDLIAKADMKDLNFMDAVTIVPSANRHSNKVQLEVADKKTLRVKIETLQSKPFPITLTSKGKPRAGYAVGSLTASPDSVEISGPTSLMNKISKVVGEVNVDNFMEDQSVTIDLKITDVNNEEIKDESISFQSNIAVVHVDILSSKSVPLKFKTQGDPAQGYEVSEIKSEPSSIALVGNAEVLEEISAINIPAAACDVTEKSGKAEFVLDIKNYLPANVKLADEDTSSVLVTIMISEMNTKTVEVPTGQVKINNQPEKTKTVFPNGTNISVKAAGSEEALNALHAENITVTFDVKDFAIGSYTLNPIVTLPEGVELAEPLSVTVNVIEAVNADIQE